MSTTTISCAQCQAPCSSAARNNCCSLRCSWKSSQQCVQCGRQVKNDKLPFGDSHPDFKTFCGPLCLDEARRGNWCIACGVKQVTTQGLSRCSNECMAVDVPLPHESPFPSRRTTPGEGENNSNNQQQQMNNNNNGLSRRASFVSTTSSTSTNHNNNKFYKNNNNQQQQGRPNSREMNNNNDSSRPTCSSVQPGSKLWERITTPFFRAGLQCYQVIQVNNNASDKKAYNAYRLSVDQKLASNGITKYGFGGEGNEHKRFVPLMAGCGGHLYGLRLASQVSASAASTSSSSSNNSSPHYHHKNNHHHNTQSNNNNSQQQQTDAEGYPCVCSNPSCDVCRILESGLKLTSVAGRTSHFSVPTLDSVLSWCADASSTINQNSPQQTRFQAVALVRTVLGNVQVVNDFDQVCAEHPPQGYDSVVCSPQQQQQQQNGTSNNNVNAISDVKTDNAFVYNDQGILAEYIVLFTNPNQQ